MVIRRFESTDLEQVASVEKTCFGAEAWPAEEFEFYASRWPNTFLVSDNASEVVAYAIAMTGRSAAELASIGVLPPYRGRGVATQLLSALCEYLRDQRITHFNLMVRTDNASAIGFYESRGFAHLGQFDEYYEDGSPAFRMQLRIA